MYCAWFQSFVVKKMRTALFWAVTQRVVVIPFRRFGTTYRSRLRVSLAVFLGSWPLKMGPSCPETSVRNYHYSLCNNPEECSSLEQLNLLKTGNRRDLREFSFFVVQTGRLWLTDFEIQIHIFGCLSAGRPVLSESSRLAWWTAR